MKSKIQIAILLLATLFVSQISCRKEINEKDLFKKLLGSQSGNNDDSQLPAFDLNVKLYGNGNSMAHLKFRQDPDPAKIIDLEVTVYHLEPHHEYLFERAVDAANVVDGSCTSTTWLTLGKGLVPQSIWTDKHGKASVELWRDVSAIPTGSSFDIHFRVIDALTKTVVLTSDCHHYTVR